MSDNVSPIATPTATLAGRAVGRVGFGAMQLAGPGVFGPPRNHTEAIAVLKTVVELGINHVDTSQFYGPDVVNELIREALYPYPADLVLVSKVGARRDDQGNWLPDQHPKALKDAVHANLKALGLEQLPVCNLRVMPREELPNESDFSPFDEQLQAMQELVAEGSLGAFGVSNVTPTQAVTGIEAGAVCVQNPYNLLMKTDEPTIDLTRSKGVAYVPFFPLGSAFPNMPKVPDDPVVQQIASAKGITPAQVGLAWLLQHSPNILLIPGTSSVQHLRENTAVRDIHLDADEVAQLDVLS